MRETNQYLPLQGNRARGRSYPAEPVKYRSKAPGGDTKLPYLIAIFLLSTWDFYIEWPTIIRPFDYISCIVLLCMIMFRESINDTMKNLERDLPVIMVLTSLCVIYGAVGILRDPEVFKAALSLCFGIVILTIFLAIPISHGDLRRLIRPILILHSSFLIFQYVWSIYYGDFLSPFNLLDREVRAFSTYVRYTGLFLEPADYAITVALLLALYLRDRFDIDFVTIITLLSIIISKSLSGIAVATAMIFCLALRNRAPIRWVVVLSIGIVFLFIYASVSTDGYFVDRLVNLDTDESANVRLPDWQELMHRMNGDIYLWFGNGVGYDYDYLGHNSFGFLFYTMGLFGFFVFVGSICWIGRPAWLNTAFLLLLSLTLAPIWGQMFWWMWLALLGRRFESDR